MRVYLQRGSNGLSLVPKLKYEHINLTSYSRMRVGLAAQVKLMVMDVIIVFIYRSLVHLLLMH